MRRVMNVMDSYLPVSWNRHFILKKVLWDFRYGSSINDVTPLGKVQIINHSAKSLKFLGNFFYKLRYRDRDCDMISLMLMLKGFP